MIRIGASREASGRIPRTLIAVLTSLPEDSEVQEIPTISVCVPYFRGQATIERCLQSIANQRGISPGELQVVVCAGQEDAEFLQPLATQYGFELHIGPSRRGLAGDWSAALSRGRGVIRTLLHQDDWYELHTLARVRELFAADPALAAVCCTSVVHDHAGKTEVKPRVGGSRMQGAEFAAELLKFRSCPAPSSMFISGARLDGLPELYSDRYSYCPELDLYARLMKGETDAVVIADEVAVVNRAAGPANYGRANVHLKVTDYMTAYLEHTDLRRLDMEPLVPMQSGFGVINARFVELLERLNTLNPGRFKTAMRDIHNVVAGEPWNAYLTLHPTIAEDLGKQLCAMYRRMPFLPAIEAVEGSARLRQEAREAWNRARFLGLFGLGKRRARWMWMILPLVRLYRKVKGRIVRRRRTTEPPVLIVGFHHSGTRLVAELLHDMGVFQVATSQTYESRYVQLLNMLLLPDWNDPAAIRSADVAARSRWLDYGIMELHLRAAGYRDGSWGHKDPRTGSVLEAWFRLYPDAKVIHVIRDPLDVIGTLPAGYDKYTPGGKRPQDAVQHWSALWIETLEKIRSTRKYRRYMELKYESLCAAPMPILEGLAEFLGLPRPPRRLARRIVPGLSGQYREWKRDGRLSAESVEFLKRTLAPYRTMLGYED